MNKFIMIGLAGLIGLASTMGGCRKYNEPKYVEIQNNETAFMIPLEGDSMKQDAFESENFLKERKVATRRVQITRRWNKTGRFWWRGEWIDTVRLIQVDRSPRTREWVAGNDRSIWVESRDSVGFSVDITVVANIREQDVTKFLYLYPSDSGRGSRLDYVLDNEVRAHIQNHLASKCAEFDMDLLRTMKNEIMEHVRSNVIPYFAERGITITSIGMGSGFAYESQEIQRAIDAVVEAQQDKASAAAEQEAQSIRNETAIELAEADKQVAALRADARKYEIDQAIAAGDEYIELLRIEALNRWIEKWNGVRPNVEVTGDGGNGMGSGMGILLDVPTNTQ